MNNERNCSGKLCRKAITFTLLILVSFKPVFANNQFWPGDNWFNNPLGFEPIKLHTSMGFIIPAAVVGTCLLIAGKDHSIANRISVYNESGFSWGYKYPNTMLSQNNTGINVQVRKWMSVGTELSFLFPNDTYNHTTGIAVRPFARFYPINRETWNMYFESGGGFVYLFDNFPKPTVRDSRLGTHLNGITKYGVGSEISVNSGVSVLFGMRHLHISNGNTKGVERNPSHDSNGFFIGFSCKL